MSPDPAPDHPPPPNVAIPDEALAGPTLVVDGDCVLCARTVAFVLARDKGDTFRFAAAQAPVGSALMRRFDLDPEHLTTVLLIEDGRAFTQASAAARTLKRLRQPWAVMGGALGLVPGVIANPAYRFVAKRRYRWFGKADACLMATPGVRARLY